MYLTNPKIIPKENRYSCNKIIGKWLVYQRDIPLLGRDAGLWYFARTEALETALKELPFWKIFISSAEERR